MLLVGRYQKEVNLKVNPLRYENNNSFTKLIHTPIRDSSFPAVQRAKSAFQKRCGLGLEKKVKKLDSFKAEVLREKQQFAEFEKYKNFYEKVDKIVEKRKKSEEKAAVMIQSAFKGFSSRKIYLEVTYNQKRIEIDREVTKKLLAEMQRYSENCFTVLVGNSAATMIQKHVKRYFTRKLFLENINFIKSKLKFEQNCVLKIQKKFRQYLTSEIIAVKKFEAYREKRLQEIKENHSVKVITNFMKEALEKILKEKEELRKFNEVSKRRKGITNTMRVRVSTKREISPYGQLFDAFSPLVPLEKFNYIPNVYSIFRPVTSKQRKLTQAEKTQLHTESSCSRRKSISVCRNSGPLLRNPKLPIETVSNSMVFYTESIKKKNLEKFAHITPNVQGHTESSYNRANAEDTPPTPEFFKSESKYKKIHWNFLKPTASFENYKKTVIGNITKSTVFTTYSSKTPTPYITRPSTGKV